jgi:hypothetical protein
MLGSCKFVQGKIIHETSLSDSHWDVLDDPAYVLAGVAERFK